MTESELEARTGAVGSLIDVPEGATVRWPDYTERVVTGGHLVLDQPGTFVIDGVEVDAR